MQEGAAPRRRWQLRGGLAASAEDALDRLRAGDVLVTTLTTPTFEAVMAIAGAVVTEHGGLMSHTANGRNPMNELLAAAIAIAVATGSADPEAYLGALEASPCGPPDVPPCFTAGMSRRSSFDDDNRRPTRARLWPGP